MHMAAPPPLLLATLIAAKIINIDNNIVIIQDHPLPPSLPLLKITENLPLRPLCLNLHHNDLLIKGAKYNK